MRFGSTSTSTRWRRRTASRRRVTAFHSRRRGGTPSGRRRDVCTTRGSRCRPDAHSGGLEALVLVDGGRDVFVDGGGGTLPSGGGRRGCSDVVDGLGTGLGSILKTPPVKVDPGGFGVPDSVVVRGGAAKAVSVVVTPVSRAIGLPN